MAAEYSLKASSFPGCLSLNFTNFSVAAAGSHFCKVNFGSLFSALIFCRSSELICLCVQLNFRGSCASMSANFVCSLFIFQLYIVMVFTTTRTDISITCYFDRFSEPSKLYWYLMMFNFLSWWNTHTHTHTTQQEKKNSRVKTVICCIVTSCSMVNKKPISIGNERARQNRFRSTKAKH